MQRNLIFSTPSHYGFVSVVSPFVTTFLMRKNFVDTVLFVQSIQDLTNFSNSYCKRLAEGLRVLSQVHQAIMDKRPVSP